MKKNKSTSITNHFTWIYLERVAAFCVYIVRRDFNCSVYGSVSNLVGIRIVNIKYRSEATDAVRYPNIATPRAVIGVLETPDF